MAAENIVEHLRRYHYGQQNAATSRELEAAFDFRQHRTIPGTHLACIMFRQIARKCSAIHKVFPALFSQSDENSVCAICIPKLCGIAINGKELRNTINTLRRSGVPVASNARGYFYAATAQEVRDTIAHMSHRIIGIARAINGLNGALAEFDSPRMRLPLDGGGGP